MRRIGLWTLCLGLAALGVACSKNPAPPQQTPPGAVTLAKPPAEDIGPNYVFLRWTQCQAPDFASYEVHQLPSQNTPPSSATLKAILGGRDNTSYEATQLATQTTYWFLVRTVSRSGATSLSAPESVTTISHDVTAPAAVTLQPAVDSSYNSVQIRWTANRQRDFDRYVVYYDSLPDFEPSAATTFGTHPGQDDTTAVVIPLSESTHYYFQIGVYNFAQKRSLSNRIRCWTLEGGDIIPPPSVGQVALSNVSNNSITASWARCPDAVTDWASYRVLGSTTFKFGPKDEASVPVHTMITDRNQTTFTATGLIPDSTYYFMVVSYDKSGNFSQSSGYASVRTRPPANPLFKFGVFGTGPGALLSPTGVAIDSRGRAYIANTGNNRVDAFNSPLADNPPTLSDTSVVSGWKVGGPGSPISLNHPDGVAVDAQDNLYVVDTGNSRIVHVASDGTLLDTFGSYGVDNAPQSYNTPTSMAIDDSGFLWICDRGNNRVKCVRANGDTIVTLPKNNLQAPPGHPMGICFEPLNRRIYVTDQDNHRVVEYDLNGERRDVLGHGPGSDPGSFDRPGGIATDGLGHLFIADTDNDRIQVYSVLDTLNVRQIYQFGQFGITAGNSDIQRPPLFLRKPQSLAFSGTTGLVLDTDNTRVVVLEMALESLSQQRPHWGRAVAAHRPRATRR